MRKLLIAILAAWPSAGLGQTFDRTVEGWDVFGSRTEDGRGVCVMEGSFRSNTRVRVILRTGETTFYFRFTNPAWRSIQNRDSLPLTFEFDADSEFSVTATGLVSSEGEHGFLFGRALEGDLFVGAFAASRGMSIRRNGAAVDHFSLRGTRAGLHALVECTAAVGNSADYDPFANGAQRRD